MSLLFLGVGIQPAVAKVEPKTPNNDDCDICPSIEDLVDSKDVEKYKVLSDMNNEFSETFRNIRSIMLTKEIKPICAILFLILLQYEIRWTILFKILSLFPIIYILFYDSLYSYVILRFSYLFTFFYTIGWEMDCDWVSVPPPIPKTFDGCPCQQE